MIYEQTTFILIFIVAMSEIIVLSLEITLMEMKDGFIKRVLFTNVD